MTMYLSLFSVYLRWTTNQYFGSLPPSHAVMLQHAFTETSPSFPDRPHCTLPSPGQLTSLGRQSGLPDCTQWDIT